MFKKTLKTHRKKRLSATQAALYGIFSLLLAAALFCGVCDYCIPDSLSFYSGDISASIYSDENLPVGSTFYSIDLENEAVVNTDAYLSETTATAKLLGTIPLKNVEVSIFNRTLLTPGGMPFGVKFYTDGVVIVGMNDVVTDSGSTNPARDAGLKVKDIIKKINGSDVSDVSDVTSLIEKSEGKPLIFTVSRGGSPSETLDLTVTPVYSASDAKYKTGLWVRSSTAGIGTVTFINASDNSFAGLGHGICDIDTGMLLPLGYGTVVDVAISGVNKGKAGEPGELLGHFTETGKTGVLLGNTETGVYGVLADLPKTLHTGENEYSNPMPIALKSEVKEGDAYILCTVTDSNKVCKYSVKLSRIDRDSTLKNFVVTVTDPDLLAITGGIVQGMSGSPIIQDGKLVGAVTHVLINDPCRGYGIFIENMLEAAG